MEWGGASSLHSTTHIQVIQAFLPIPITVTPAGDEGEGQSRGVEVRIGA